MTKNMSPGSTTERAAQIRAALKAKGWTSRDVSGGAIMTTTTPDTPMIITAPAEYRQIAKHMAFPPDFVRHINWEAIAQTARELGAHFEARYSQTGECTITMFWSYTEDELNGLSWTGRK